MTWAPVSAAQTCTRWVLTGPPGSGKTHLVQVWAAETGAQVIDAATLGDQAIDTIAKSPFVAVEDADRIAGDSATENNLFHLHNLVLADGGHLLITGATPPALWPIALPDLASRLQGCSVVSLNTPDDALLSAVVVKLFSDRQLHVNPKVISYVVTRMERSFDAAHAVVNALDTAALTQKRAITAPMARQVLDNLWPLDP